MSTPITAELPILTPFAETPVATAEAPATAAPPHHLNSVDATMGQPMVERVMDRKRELERLLGGLGEQDTSTRDEIGAALAAIEPLLTGDLENVPAVVVVDMNRWLEAHKHLGERAAPAIAG